MLCVYRYRGCQARLDGMQIVANPNLNEMRSLQLHFSTPLARTSFEIRGG